MCGRARCALSPEQIIAHAAAITTTHTNDETTTTPPPVTWQDQDHYAPSHNVCPGFFTPVIHLNKEKTHPIVHTMRWGLIPSFTPKSTEKFDYWRMFNARAETIAEKPSFRRLVPSRRCIVPMNGFYEWKKEGGTVEKGKQPYYVYLVDGEGKERPMMMAGLWDVWHRRSLDSGDGGDGGGGDDDVEDEVVYSYTILTTDSCEKLEWLHDRMPVILKDEEAQRLWLDTTEPSTVQKLHSLLVPYRAADLRWHPVTKEMTSLKFQEPAACLEVKKPSIMSFFQPKTSLKTPEKSKIKKEEEDEESEAAPSTTLVNNNEKLEANPDEKVVAVESSTAGVGSSSGAGGADAAKISTTPISSAKKRKQTTTALKSTPTSTTTTTPGSAKKKARPAGQPDIAAFFTKK